MVLRNFTFEVCCCDPVHQRSWPIQTTILGQISFSQMMYLTIIRKLLYSNWYTADIIFVRFTWDLAVVGGPYSLKSSSLVMLNHNKFVLKILGEPKW